MPSKGVLIGAAAATVVSAALAAYLYTRGKRLGLPDCKSKGRKPWLIVHHGRSPPGAVLPFLHTKGRHTVIVDLGKGEELPPVDDAYEGIVLLGGYQGAYEEKEYPFLIAEKEFIRQVPHAHLRCRCSRVPSIV